MLITKRTFDRNMGIFCNIMVNKYLGDYYISTGFIVSCSHAVLQFIAVMQCIAVMQSCSLAVQSCSFSV